MRPSIIFHLLLLWCILHPVTLSPSRLHAAQKAWLNESPLLNKTVEELRQQTWRMFDYGFSNYMKHAFPKDNLLPLSCRGENWLGGIAVTLIDSLDTLLVMNRRDDIEVAIRQLREHVTFNIDAKAHVFETLIRVLGGLLSAHSLIAANKSLVPGYDDVLLRMAADLGDRLMPAFTTSSRLPFLYVNLQKGVLADTNITCTACAGTLLLEMGMLTALTGNQRYLAAAEHAAHALYERRSRLGLVGASLDVNTHTWVAKESTIGPGSDSYYEYLLKSYLMFGNISHLEMFADLYSSTMRYMQLPNTPRSLNFMVDVNMDSGQLAKVYVSSLGAFWPGMQALAGQEAEAVGLHANYTAAWRTFGWLPELFGVDLGKVHPEDPGYNLRPEHIESTYILHELTGEPTYLATAARIQEALEATTRTNCGYARIDNVATGERGDLMESFFLSETLKYLYLTFGSIRGVSDHFVFSTQGHLLPPVPAAGGEAEVEDVPLGCEAFCSQISNEDWSAQQQALLHMYPLLPFRLSSFSLIRQRRCVACSIVTQRMTERPPLSNEIRQRIMKLPATMTGEIASPIPYIPNHVPPEEILAQLVCPLVVFSNAIMCNMFRGLTQNDIRLGLPQNSVILQLSETGREPLPEAAVLVWGGERGEVSLYLEAGGAHFGPPPPQPSEACVAHVLGGMGLVGDTHYAVCPVDHFQPPEPPLCWPWQAPALFPPTTASNPCLGTPLTHPFITTVEPKNACGPIANIRGMIALVYRGECNFAEKAQYVAAAGGTAMLVLDPDEQYHGTSMSHDGRSSPTPLAMAALIGGSATKRLLNALNHSARLLRATIITPPPTGERLQTVQRLELLIPTTSNAFVQNHLTATKMPLGALFDIIASDSRAVGVLSQVVRENALIRQQSGSGMCQAPVNTDRMQQRMNEHSGASHYTG